MSKAGVTMNIEIVRSNEAKILKYKKNTCFIQYKKGRFVCIH